MRFQKHFIVVLCLMLVLVGCSVTQSIPSQSGFDSVKQPSRLIESTDIVDSFNTVNELYGFQEISTAEFTLLKSKYAGSNEDFLIDAAAISQAVALDVGSVTSAVVTLQTTVNGFITSEYWDDGQGN